MLPRSKRSGPPRRTARFPLRLDAVPIRLHPEGSCALRGPRGARGFVRRQLVPSRAFVRGEEPLPRIYRSLDAHQRVGHPEWRSLRCVRPGCVVVRGDRRVVPRAVLARGQGRRRIDSLYRRTRRKDIIVIRPFAVDGFNRLGRRRGGLPLRRVGFVAEWFPEEPEQRFLPGVLLALLHETTHGLRPSDANSSDLNGL